MTNDKAKAVYLDSSPRVCRTCDYDISGLTHLIGGVSIWDGSTHPDKVNEWRVK